MKNQDINWNDLRVLIAVQEGGSLSAASNELGLSIATVSRRIEGLEKELGVPLIERYPQGVRFTKTGNKIIVYAKRAKGTIGEINRVAARARDKHDEPIRISSTETVFNEILMPKISELPAKSKPIQLSVETKNINLNQHEAHLAIRLGRPTSPSLVIRKLAEIKLGVFASHDFFRTWKGDLVQEMPLIGVDDSFGNIPEVKWIQQHAPFNPVPFRSSSIRSLVLAAQSGVGAAIIPSFLGRRYGLAQIQAPTIESRKPFLAFHSDYKASARVVATRKWIVSAFDQLKC